MIVSNILLNEIENCFEIYADNIFVYMKEEVITYKDFQKNLYKKVSFLKDLGFSSGDVIAIYYKNNSLELIYNILATVYLEAKCCLIPPNNQSIEDINEFCDWLITDQNIHSNNYLIYDSEKEYIYSIKTNFILPNEFISAWLIMPTSGTTGDCKWIFLSGESIQNTVLSIKKYMQTDVNDKFIILKNLSYISSLTSDLLLSLFSGGSLTVNIVDFNLHSIINLIEKYEITILTLVPTILKLLLNSKDYKKLGNIRKISLVGASADKLLLMDAIDKLPKASIFIGYGLTEASSRVTYLPSNMLLNKIESIGIPMEDVIVKIMEDGKNIEKPYTIGEIAIKSPGLMLGYINKGEVYLFNKEFLVTNDLGYFDDEGYFYHCGRKDDVMVINGINITPIQVEKYIKLIDYVKECVVYKGYTLQKCDQINALIQIKDGIVVSEKDLYEKMIKVIPLSLLPQKINIVDHIPTQLNGKISRKKIADIYNVKDK